MDTPEAFVAHIRTCLQGGVGDRSLAEALRRASERIDAARADGIRWSTICERVNEALRQAGYSKVSVDTLRGMARRRGRRPAIHARVLRDVRGQAPETPPARMMQAKTEVEFDLKRGSATRPASILGQSAAALELQRRLKETDRD